MKQILLDKKTIVIGAGLAFLLVLSGLCVGLFLSSQPESSSHAEHDHGSHPVSPSGSAGKKEEVLWTCSMHPQIKQPNPGKCPICGMDLIPLKPDDGQGDAGPRTLTLSENAKTLARIETVAVERRFPEAEIPMVGKIDYDETRLQAITARFPARIDQLYVNYTGIRVKRGEHLAKVYSPDLLTAQRELLTALQFDSKSSVVDAAREKLRLWDLLPEQIQAIEKSGVLREHLELKAPLGGIVVEKHVKEGDYLKTGDPLFKIADLEHLWVYLDAYESDIAWLRYGQKVSFEVEAYPGEMFEGRIVFIDPVMDQKTRTIKIRVEAKNEDGRLKPGMFVRARVHSRIAEGGKVFAPEFSGKWISPMHPEIVRDEPGDCPVCGMPLVKAEELGYTSKEQLKPPLIIPRSAVLRTGKRAVVYVERSPEKPVYEGREIVLGPRTGDFFIVQSGLHEGERVVSNGAFKIDSALQIQAKPSMMNPQEGTVEMSSTATHTHKIAVGQDFRARMEAVLEAYFSIQRALAKDQLLDAQASATQLLERLGKMTGDSLPPESMSSWKESENQIRKAAEALIKADSLDHARGGDFALLSEVLSQAIGTYGTSQTKAVYWMYCPMALKNKGAHWLQDHPDIKNPYFGSSMLGCGEVKSQLVTPSGNQNDNPHSSHEH